MPQDREGYNAILVVVDCLGKRPFSIPTFKTCTTAELARLYYQYPWRIYRTLETITLDRGPQFIAAFLDKLAKLTRIELCILIAEHP